MWVADRTTTLANDIRSRYIVLINKDKCASSVFLTETIFNLCKFFQQYSVSRLDVILNTYYQGSLLIKLTLKIVLRNTYTTFRRLKASYRLKKQLNFV